MATTIEQAIALAAQAGLRAEYWTTMPPRLSGFVKLVDGRYQCALTLEQFWMLVQLARGGVTEEVVLDVMRAGKAGT